MAEFPMPPGWVTDALMSGLVIPAHPLALDSDRKLDERRQRALTRYYAAAGSGGVAVGVHTTQFAIRDKGIDLFKPVLNLAAETIDEIERDGSPPLVRVAGICGKTVQASSEARLALDNHFHAGLLSLSALKDESEEKLINHCLEIAKIIPLFGFYLQPAVGGRILSYSFWRRFVEISNVVAIKIAPFNRYQTLDVVRAVVEAGRQDEIALYTGNDDHILHDLLTPWKITTPGGQITIHIAGGLLGHWAFWTRRAVEQLDECKRIRQEKHIPTDFLSLAEQITDCNAAVFDAANQFAGCIPGIHTILRRQGLLANSLCLDPQESLSPGQSDEIDRVYSAYPHLSDDDFVRDHLDTWLT